MADDGTTETAVNHMRATMPARPGRLRRIRYSFECLGWRAAMTELANGVDAPESELYLNPTRSSMRSMALTPPARSSQAISASAMPNPASLRSAIFRRRYG